VVATAGRPRGSCAHGRTDGRSAPCRHRREPPGDAAAALFFAGTAFLAGFSERFARDMMAAPSQLLEGDKHRGKGRPGAP
jgi:hypothetical protein